MNLFKKLLCLTLATALMVVSFCGCHKKGEIAVKIDDTDFTTGMYLAVLYEEGIIALNKIDTSNLDTTKDGYYRSQKIDGKVYGDYTTEKTLESLKKIVALEKYMKKYDLKLTAEEEKTIKENYTQLWNKKFVYNEEESYSLGKYLENNGVSKETYLKIMRGIQIEDNIFDKMYGKEGKKAITDEELKKFFTENYVLYNSVSSSTYSAKTDEEKAEIKAKYEEMESKVNSGSVSFEEAYKELLALDSTEDGTDTSTEAQTPQDSYADKDDEDTYKTVSALANNNAKLVVSDDNTSITLYYKKDISTDENGLTTYDESIRHAMKDDEFNKEVEAIAKDLKVTKYKSALSAVKIDKINFHEYMEVYQTALNELTGNMTY